MSSSDNKLITIGIFREFSKAFHTFDHSIWILKLGSIRLGNEELNWFNIYLANRHQSTVINIRPTTSDVLPMTCGVPDKSIILEPSILIYIYNYVNELEKV